MAFTQSDIDTLDLAIKSGELSVRFSDGREVTYRSISDLQKARAMMQSEVGTATGTRRIRQVRLYSEKGF